MTIRIACVFDDAGLTAYGRESGEGRADIVILPELFDGGYKRLHQDKGVSPDIQTLESRFAEFSNRNRLTLVAGTVARRGADGRIRNTSLIFHHGSILCEVSKTHLFRPLGDDQYFAVGRPMDTIEVDCGKQRVRTGIIICYDLRFPEIVRPWFKRGLELLIVPARWPRVRDDVWKLLLRARAVENQCFVVGVNSRDDEGGGSYAFGPDGRAVLELPPADSVNSGEWTSFEIDLRDIEIVKDRLDTRLDAHLL